MAQGYGQQPPVPNQQQNAPRPQSSDSSAPISASSASSGNAPHTPQGGVGTPAGPVTARGTPLRQSAERARQRIGLQRLIEAQPFTSASSSSSSSSSSPAGEQPAPSPREHRDDDDDPPTAGPSTEGRAPRRQTALNARTTIWQAVKPRKYTRKGGQQKSAAVIKRPAEACRLDSSPEQPAIAAAGPVATPVTATPAGHYQDSPSSHQEEENQLSPLLGPSTTASPRRGTPTSASGESNNRPQSVAVQSPRVDTSSEELRSESTKPVQTPAAAVETYDAISPETRRELAAIGQEQNDLEETLPLPDLFLEDQNYDGYLSARDHEELESTRENRVYTWLGLTPPNLNQAAPSGNYDLDVVPNPPRRYRSQPHEGHLAGTMTTQPRPGNDRVNRTFPAADAPSPAVPFVPPNTTAEQLRQYRQQMDQLHQQLTELEQDPMLAPFIQTQTRLGSPVLEGSEQSPQSQQEDEPVVLSTSEAGSSTVQAASPEQLVQHSERPAHSMPAPASLPARLEEPNDSRVSPGLRTSTDPGRRPPTL